MAFKMNRPVIKGTKSHKESLLKAKKPIVEMTRTKAESSLVTGSEKYGKSFVPHEIDFGIDWKKPSFGEKDDEKDGCTDETATNYNPKATKDDGSCEYKEEKEEKEALKLDPIDPGSAGKGVEIPDTLEKATIDSGKARKGKEALELDTIDPRKGVEVSDTLEKATIPKDLQKRFDKSGRDVAFTIAEENPKYNIKKPTRKIEGQLSFSTMDPQEVGYSLKHKLDEHGNKSKEWTYNGHVINENEVPNDEYANYDMDPDMSTMLHPSVTRGSKGTDNIITRGNKPPQDIDRSLKGTPKPHPSDFKDKKNVFGGIDTKSSQYQEARKKWYNVNPTGEDNKGVEKPQKETKESQETKVGGKLRSDLEAAGTQLKEDLRQIENKLGELFKGKKKKKKKKKKPE